MYTYVTKHSKYKIKAPTEISMALQIEKWPHIFPTSGAIVPATSFAFLGPAKADENLQITSLNLHVKCILNTIVNLSQTEQV